MKDQTKKIFRNAELIVQGNIIKCEDNSIQVSNISQMWVGKLPKEKISLNLFSVLLLMAFLGYYFINSSFTVLAVLIGLILLLCKYIIQVEYDGLNLELCSGEIYSFVSRNIGFVKQVHTLLNTIIAGKEDTTDYYINFRGNGEITDHLTVLNAEELIIEENDEEETTIKINDVNEKLTTEMKILYNNYKEKTDMNEEVLTLIIQTADQIKEDRKEGIKESYEKFITLGLINECNELELNLLIEEIKKNIFI